MNKAPAASDIFTKTFTYRGAGNFSIHLRESWRFCFKISSRLVNEYSLETIKVQIADIIYPRCESIVGRMAVERQDILIDEANRKFDGDVQANKHGL